MDTNENGPIALPPNIKPSRVTFTDPKSGETQTLDGYGVLIVAIPDPRKPAEAMVASFEPSAFHLACMVAAACTQLRTEYGAQGVKMMEEVRAGMYSEEKGADVTLEEHSKRFQEKQDAAHVDRLLGSLPPALPPKAPDGE